MLSQKILLLLIKSWIFYHGQNSKASWCNYAVTSSLCVYNFFLQYHWLVFVYGQVLNSFVYYFITDVLNCIFLWVTKGYFRCLSFESLENIAIWCLDWVVFSRAGLKVGKVILNSSCWFKRCIVGEYKTWLV